jgi:hypothetical protein
MRYLKLVCVILCLGVPAQAQTEPAEGDGIFAMLEQFLRSFITEVEPQLRDHQQGLDDLQTELEGVLERRRDIARYHPPEMLPNGDILIRRRQPEEGTEEDDPGPEPFEL